MCNSRSASGLCLSPAITANNLIYQKVNHMASLYFLDSDCGYTKPSFSFTNQISMYYSDLRTACQLQFSTHQKDSLYKKVPVS